MTNKRTPPRLLRVVRTEQLSPSMRRVVLGGPELTGFPVDSAGAHIKLLLPRPGQIQPILPTLGPEGPVWPPNDVRPIARTYTVSSYDAKAGELAVDFVLHDDEGPASQWATRAREGDAIGVAGPGGPRRFVPDAASYLLLGDPSAVPVLAAVLANLPDHASGHTLIEIGNHADVQNLKRPAGVELVWLVRGAQRPGDSTLLLDAARALDWPMEPVSVTLAGESRQVVTLRDYLLHERGVAADAMYAVPYWKDRHTEEAYHAERHQIMDRFEAEEKMEATA
ncbi:siderophore-interacting protein [Massilia sp. CF038]|uniref:siderophore-interacting protein n=1 Tax=Massilia sp. CF038 TaxID=1881045 RepID=UPI00090F94EA|nr:siderophore-interacting protein [Massilia sp. CF038]SHH53335.1 NADPH-dependent ferric siderophore reductase, contains FAD-binding and SIP domains [Massilia sp. CF038]